MPSPPRTPPPNSRVLFRPALACGLAFLDAAEQEAMDARALTTWFESHLVRQGALTTPSTVQEPGVGVVSLREFQAAPSGRLEFQAAPSGRLEFQTTPPGRHDAPPSGSRQWVAAFEERLREIVRAARLRVSLSLQGLLALPVDDRFLTSAIFGERVVREAMWRPKLKGTERLSDIVLAVFAADILSHREEYDAALCVCAICGHVSLSRTAIARTRCAAHASARNG